MTAPLKGSVFLVLERASRGVRVDRTTTNVPTLKSGERVVRLSIEVPAEMFQPRPIPDIMVSIDPANVLWPPPLFEQMPQGRALTQDEADRMTKTCPDCPHAFGLHGEDGVCRVGDCPCILPDTVRAAERLGRAVRS